MVWQLWTRPASWAGWDRGLRSAELVGPFRTGATGRLVDLRGRESAFVVDEVVEGRRCRYHVRLPGGRLVLTRTLGDGAPVTVRHEVAFSGPLSLVWAVVLGRGFRRQLPPTLDDLVAVADGPGS